MEVKLKSNDVLNLNRTLKAIIDGTQTNVDALLKFKLLGIMKEIENYISNFNVIYNEKIMEYGKKNDEDIYEIPLEDKESIKNFNEDMKKVVDSEVVINIIKIKSNEIFDKGIKSEYLIGLYPIIEE